MFGHFMIDQSTSSHPVRSRAAFGVDAIPSQTGSVIASLRLLAVALGVGIGSLTATLLALVFWALLALVGFENAPLAGLAAAVLVGFGAAGYSAGRLAPHTHRFHGSVAGLGLSGLVLIIARLGGSPAPLPQVLLLFAFGIVVGGAAGIAGGRRG